MKYLILVALIGLMLSGCAKKRTAEAPDKRFETAVSEAIDRQMQSYPKSTLKDLYKSFFQDKFGPGHIIADTTGAGAYLRRELASYTETKGEVAEPTGWEGNFFRVNLSAIKENRVPYAVYLDAFFRSAQGIVPPALPDWIKEWEGIETVIRSKNLALPGYEADLAEINQNLEKGVYMGHHSAQYEEAYSPHYRIISRKIYEAEILPLLEK